MGFIDDIFKFGTEADPNKWVEGDWTQINNIYMLDRTNNLWYDGRTGDVGGFYKVVSYNRSDTWDFIIRSNGKTTHASQDFDYHQVQWVKLPDGNYYIVGTTNSDDKDFSLIGYHRQLTRPDNTFATLTTNASKQSVNPFEDITYVYGLRFHKNGNVDLIRGDYNSDDPFNPIMTVLDADIYSGVDITVVSEVGFVNNLIIGGSINNIFFLMIEADNSAIGGSITNPGFTELHSKSFIGTIGNATGEVQEQDLTNMALHIANIGEYANIIMTNGNIAFQGEMRRPKNTGPHKLEYEFVHNGQKFNRMDGATDPQIESRFVRYMDWEEPANINSIFDNNDEFPDYSSRIAVFNNKNLKKKTYHPTTTPNQDVYVRDIINSEQSSPSAGVFVTPDTVDGSADHLYFFDADEPTDNSDLALATANEWGSELFPGLSTEKSLAQLLIFDLFLDQAPSTADYISKLTISMTVSFRRLNHYVFSSNPDANSYPLILIKNVTTGFFDTIRLIEKEDAGGSSKRKDNDDIFGEDETPNITFTVELTQAQITSMFSLVEDNGTTLQYKGIVAVRSGIASSIQILGSHTVHVRNMEMVIEFESNETETQGHFAIDIQGGDANELPFESTAGLPVFPSQAGFSAGDSYKIVPTVEDYITDLYATIKSSKSLIWDLDLNLTDADIWGMVGNFADRYVVSVWQDVTGRFNGIWYIDEDANTFVIKSVDNLTTASQTITKLNILDNTLYFDIDGSKITNEVTVIGKNSKVSQVVSATALSLGLETTIETDPSLIDLGSVQNRADDIKKRTQASLDAFAIKVDIDSIDYTELKKGVLVPVKLPDASDPYIIDDTLLVIGQEYRIGVSTGQKGVLMFHVRKRFS